MGTLFEKALDEIHGQTLQILGFLNIGNIQFILLNLRLCALGKRILLDEGSPDARSALAINLEVSSQSRKFEFIVFSIVH